MAPMFRLQNLYIDSQIIFNLNVGLGNIDTRLNIYQTVWDYGIICAVSTGVAINCIPK